MEKKAHTLLIAEDEENILRAMEKYIRSHSSRFEEIYTAQNGQQSLDMIVRCRPDIVLTDVKMPLKTGLQVMEEAGQMGLHPKTVILSGFDTFSYAQQALRMGAVDYLLKPCSARDILEKLENIADKLDAAEAEKTPKAPLKGMPATHGMSVSSGASAGAIASAGATESQGVYAGGSSAGDVTDGGSLSAGVSAGSSTTSGTAANSAMALGSRAQDPSDPTIRRAVRYIRDNLSEDLSLTEVSGYAGISASYFSTLFTQTMGLGFVEYLNRARIEAACAYMHDPKMKVYEIAYQVGFRDEKYFSKVFRKETGMTPSQYRKSIWEK